MSRRRGLGRGLDALLEARPAVTSLRLTELVPNRLQPRQRFEEEGLEDLARSIRSQGLVQPIVVAPRAEGGYTIVAGERRYRAAHLAGLDEVPVVVKELSGDLELLEMALVENVQRSDLNPVEEATAYQALSDDFGLSQEAVARRVGKSRSAVANAQRLLRLPPPILDLLRDGRLTAGQARPLLAVADSKRQVELAAKAARGELNARQLEQLAAEDRQKKSRSRSSDSDVHTVAAEEKLTRAVQTKVEIRRRGKGGTVRLHFFSEEELMRLYDLLMRTGEAK